MNDQLPRPRDFSASYIARKLPMLPSIVSEKFAINFFALSSLKIKFTILFIFEFETKITNIIF